MKKLTMAKWEKEYVVGTINKFDEKNTVANRLDWDTPLKQLFSSYPTDNTKHSPGFTVKEIALRFASREFIAMVELFNTSKPNPSSISKTIKSLVAKEDVSGEKTSYEIKVDINDPEVLTRDIKKVATFFGADMVGVCKLDRRWVYSHTYKPSEKDSKKHQRQEIQDDFQYAVVMVFGENYDLRRYFPTHISAASSSNAGVREVMTVQRLSAFIHHIGFKVIDCTFDDVTIAIPMAMQAGLGQLGRHGMLITPQFGSRLRIGQILTNMPLIPDSPIDFGVTEFCNLCKKCAYTCPSKAITAGARSTEPLTTSNSANELKWQTNPELCRLNFPVGKQPCHICISVCPFNKPDTAFHKTVRWFVENVRWADSLYVKMDDLFGYGKPKKAENFWKEWQPGKH